MKLSDFAVRRPVTIAMIFLLIVLLGLVSMNKLNLDLFPELDLPLALAITSYENVGPEEMEELVTRPLESALGTVNGIKSINSISRQGSSLVVLEFSWGTDMNFAINQMREKIDLISSFLPADADKTMILKLDPNMMPIIVIGFSGDYDLVDLDKLATDVIQPRLERVEGVASVTVSGGVKREIRISAVPQRLQAYGLSLEQIIAQLRMENRDVSAGAIEEGLKEQIVRVVGAFESVQEIEDLQIPLSSGGYVRRAEIARVEDTFTDKKEFVYMDGEPSVQIAVQKQTDANTVKVSEAVRVAIADLEKDLPQKSTINIGFDQAEYINLALDQVKENAYIGAGLAVLILFLFLRNLRSTLIIGLAIPIAIIATFILMFFAGLTLNIITLGGLALGIGMMVDCSIVILENIYRYRQNGYSKIAAAREGATEVSLAVTASTLTTIVVFLPIVYVGLASQIFRPMAWTVSFALLASLVVALTLVPMLSSKILRVDALGVANGSSVPAGNKAEQKGKKKKFKPKEKLFTTWGNFLTALDELYRRILGWSIQHRKTVVFLTLGLFIMSIAVIPLVGMEFLPQQDSGEYTVNISLPNGTAVRETQRVTKIVEQYIEEMPEHEWAIYAVGLEAGMISSGSTPEKAIIRGKLTEKRERTRSLNQVLDDLRNKCASIPGAKIEINALDVAMGGLQSPIEIGLTGDNLEVLEMLAQTIATRVKEVEGAREVKTSIEDARPEVHLKLQRKKAEQYGINTTQLSSLLSTAINGTTATRYREKGEEIDVRIVLDEQYRRNINDLESLMISSPY
ncbi:MAG: efflux RND transporter permease subunit, partial [Clostridia bacterium]|nr:efflux RND transporter permease subunit [Clostridia bacterium]